MPTILSISTATPECFLSQAEALAHAKKYCCTTEKEEAVLERLYRRTTIKNRPTIFASADAAKTSEIDRFYRTDDVLGSYNPSTGERMARYKAEIQPLATRVAAQALAQAKIETESIDSLVTVSCTGFFSPGFDTTIIEQLNLSREVSRTHIGFMGCHGAINGLRVASALAQASKGTVMLVAAEICSLHFQYGSKKDDILANALFADGAAALILTVSENELKKQNQPQRRLLSTASHLISASRESMSWEIENHGFVMTLGAEVADLIRQNLPLWIEKWLASQNLTLDQIGSWAVHPGGPKILDAVEDCLGLPPEAMAASRKILAQYGNMSSPTILFILEALAAAGASGPTVVLAFGPGLSVEAALIG